MRKLLAALVLLTGAIGLSQASFAAPESDCFFNNTAQTTELCETTIRNTACGNGECVVHFPAVQSPFTVKQATCNFYFNAQNVSVTGVEMGGFQSGNITFAQFIGPVGAIFFSPTVSQYQFSTSTLQVIPQKQKPTIHIATDSSADGSADCSITGSYLGH